MATRGSIPDGSEASDCWMARCCGPSSASILRASEGVAAIKVRAMPISVACRPACTVYRRGGGARTAAQSLAWAGARTESTDLRNQPENPQSQAHISAMPSNTGKRCPTSCRGRPTPHSLNKLPFGSFLTLGDMFKLCRKLNDMFANLDVINRRGPSLQRIGPGDV